MNAHQAASFWEKKDSQAIQMDKKALLVEMEKFIMAHNTCALATGCSEFIRCTPIEYTYEGSKFWLFSEGGLKFHALEQNKKVCIAIYDSYTGFGQLHGMQVTGTAELVEPWSVEYMHLLELKKIPPESLKGLSHTMYLIKITANRIDFLSSDFKKLGFDSRQHVVF